MYTYKVITKQLHEIDAFNDLVDSAMKDGWSNVSSPELRTVIPHSGGLNATESIPWCICFLYKIIENKPSNLGGPK
jgi:hypothetical protein